MTTIAPSSKVWRMSANFLFFRTPAQCLHFFTSTYMSENVDPSPLLILESNLKCNYLCNARRSWLYQGVIYHSNHILVIESLSDFIYWYTYLCKYILMLIHWKLSTSMRCYFILFSNVIYILLIISVTSWSF